MTDAPGPQGMRLWLRLVLFGSLALNLAVIGVVAGVVLTGGPPAHVSRDGRDPVTPYVRALTEDQRDAVRGALRRSFVRDRVRGDKGPLLSGAYVRVLGLLQQEPFDRAAFDAVLSEQTEAAVARMALGQKVLGDFLQELSPEHRAAYAERLAEEVTRMRHRRPERKPDRD